MSDIRISRRAAIGLGAGVGAAGLAGVSLPHAVAAPRTGGADRAFAEAAHRHRVPRELLIALAAAETGLNNNGGTPSSSGAYGITALTQNPANSNLADAARLTRIDPEKLKSDDHANVMGTAALLAARADELHLSGADRRNLEAWHAVLTRHSRATTPLAALQYADAVYDKIAEGADGAGVRLDPRQTEPNRGASIAQLGGSQNLAVSSAEQAQAAVWVPASSSNYTVANRPTDLKITHVVVHVTQGSYAGAISWFQNPAAKSSAHYVIKSSDGSATQMVRHKDIAWHAGNWSYNQHSIGLEHEGWVSDAKWFTDTMYRSSANITRGICQTYGIPMDRQHIIGHIEVPGATHTDPGPHWDWNKYLTMVKGTQPPSWEQVVDNTTAGRFTASANWGTSQYDNQKFGANYRFAQPKEVSDPAWYRFAIPANGTYRVDVWFPAGTGYSSAAPYLIATTAGLKTVTANQTTGGGTWKTLGNFAIAGGDRNVVGVSRWTTAPGLVLADAVRLTRVG